MVKKSSPEDFVPLKVLASRTLEKKYKMLIVLYKLQVIDTVQFWSMWYPR